jgi:hypothetical protein
MTSLRTSPDYINPDEYKAYQNFIDSMSDIIKETYLSLGLKSKSFNWEDYNKEIVKQLGYFSRFVVAIDTEQIGADGRIRYRSRLYVRSAMWYYAKLLKADARKEGKKTARRVCEDCEKNLTTEWQPIIGFSFDSGLIGIDCYCYPEFE